MNTRVAEMKLSDQAEREIAARYVNEGGYLLDAPRTERWVSVAVAMAVSLVAAIIVF